MNLRLHLLIRMTLAAVLCWLGVSVIVVAQSGRHTAHEMAASADQLQSMLAAEIMRRWISVDLDPRYPDLAGAASRFPDSLCLRYTAQDGSESDSGCAQSLSSAAPPPWIVRILRAIGPAHSAERRPINAYGLVVGELRLESNDTSLVQRQWSSIRALSGLTAVTVIVLDGLALWIVGRALRPTGPIVAAVEQLGSGREDLRLPTFRPREFAQIAAGINRLAERLAQANAARSQLTARLISLQEDERRELSHELHHEFGQCASALGAMSAALRLSVADGETLTEADLGPLELGVERLLSSLRTLLQRMSQPPLTGQSVHSALADLITTWKATLPGDARIALNVDPSIDAQTAAQCALCLYRIVQECLSNISRHAPNCRQVLIDIRAGQGGLHLRVSNDVAATSALRPPQSLGMGLKLLSERARSLRGSLSVEACAHEFVVTVDLPLTP